MIKKLIFATLLMIGFSTVNFAQSQSLVIPDELIAEYNTGSSQEIAQIQFDRLNTAVTLSPEQSQKVFFLNQKVADKIKVVLNNADFTPERKAEFIKGNLTDRRSAMSQILDEQQFIVFDQLDYQ